MGKHENSQRKILIVDDDPDSAKILSAALNYEGYGVHIANCGEDAVKEMDQLDVDLVLLDINMPGISGLETLQQLRRKRDYVAVLFVSGNTDTKDVIKGLDAGADDYVRKPFDVEEVLSRIRAQLRIKDLKDDLSEANERLKELVDIDDLTGLYNMRSVYDRLNNELARGKRFTHSVSVVMMDMDHFKQVNDEHDHLFGSFVLSEVGKIIRENIRTIDFAARYGGDEFLVCLTQTDLNGSKHFAERLRKLIKDYVFDNGESSIKLTSSIGLAVSDPDIEIDARTLVRKADKCLYNSKEGGRNRVSTFSFKDNQTEEEKESSELQSRTS